MRESDERFVAFGDEVVGYLRTFGGLSPKSRVLDIGCGYGRIAHALYRSDTFKGSYIGLDILKPHIAWCQEEIQGRSRRFEFQVLDIRNDRYNPVGAIEPTEVRFPVPDGWADVVVLFSVFTHMFPEDIVHYLSEIRRVMRPSGRAVVTFLLLNETSEPLVLTEKTAYKLPYRPREHMRIMSEEDPLHAVAYDESWVLEQVRAAGLAMGVPPRYGSWSGRAGGFSFQDILVLAVP